MTFAAPGDYSFRILVNGSERKRLPLLVSELPAEPGQAPAPGGPSDPRRAAEPGRAAQLIAAA